MVDSFDFSDTETEFKRLKTDNNSKTMRKSPAASPPRTSHSSYTSQTSYNSNSNSNSSSNNRTYYDNRNGGYNGNIQNNRNKKFYNENGQDQNYRTSNYIGIRKPFKPLTTVSAFKPSIYRKALPIRTSLSKNYKTEANFVLPKFTDFKPYKGRPFEAQGYRDPKYFDSSKRTSRNISKTFTNIQPPQTQIRNNQNDFKEINQTPSVTVMKQEQEQEQVRVQVQVREKEEYQVISPYSIGGSPSINYKNDTTKDSSYFQIKTIDSYKEFCKIKVKGTIEMGKIYETISFLKSITTGKRGVKPIILFYDKVDRVFYGAAVVSLEEISEKEEIDTNTLESMIFRLNWIFLSEVEEEIINFEGEELKDSKEIDSKKGFELLKLMEQSETQLHDVKKLNPVSLKLKPSRLEELEEFYKLTERRETVTVEIVEEDFDIEIEQRDKRDKRDKRDHYDHCDHEQSKDDDDNYLYLKPAEQTQTCITTENSDDDFFADYQ